MGSFRTRSITYDKKTPPVKAGFLFAKARGILGTHMEQTVCTSCEAKLHAWQEQCRDCGFVLVRKEEQDLAREQRYLRIPSIGALLFTQGWTFGARMYVLFILSLLPGVGIAALCLSFLFGRRLSWKYGHWKDWETFTKRMRTLDLLGLAWGAGVLVVYIFFRTHGGAT